MEVGSRDHRTIRQQSKAQCIKARSFYCRVWQSTQLSNRIINIKVTIGSTH